MLELNASNDRGIDVVRNRIKTFAHQKVTLPKGRHKIIILDEADRYGETNYYFIYFSIFQIYNVMKLYNCTMSCYVQNRMLEMFLSNTLICSMTDGAQQALRRTMEIYSKTTRFALACNASDKIIGRVTPEHFVSWQTIVFRSLLFSEPIQSRCAVLRYSKLSDAQILARLLEVCSKEKVSDHVTGHMIHFTFDLSLPLY